MEIISFTPQNQQETEAFLNEIYDGMGWEELHDELSNLYTYFNLPGGGFFLLVKENDEIIGTSGCLKLSNKEGVLKRFYIHKDYRGTGVAKKLLEASINKAKEMGLSRLVLDVSRNNKRAIRFYEKNGFMRYNQSPIDLWPESYEPENYFYYSLDL